MHNMHTTTLASNMHMLFLHTLVLINLVIVHVKTLSRI